MQPEELSGRGSLSLGFGNPVASLWCGTTRWPVRCLEGDHLEVPGSGTGIVDPCACELTNHRPEEELLFEPTHPKWKNASMRVFRAPCMLCDVMTNVGE